MWDIALQNPLAGSAEMLEEGYEAGRTLDFDDRSYSSKRSRTSTKTIQSEMKSFFNDFNDSSNATLATMETKMNNAIKETRDETINETGQILNIIGTCNSMITSLKGKLQTCTDESERNVKQDQIKTLEQSIAGMFEKLKKVQQK